MGIDNQYNELSLCVPRVSARHLVLFNKETDLLKYRDE
jgi:hypothetical protein